MKIHHSDFKTISDWLFAHHSFLLVSHQHPDGDALGSLCGLHSSLKEMGFDCASYIEEPVPARYHHFMPEDLLIGSKVEFDKYDAIICLDCANAKRLSLPKGFDFEQLNLPSCNLDHHVDNSRYGEICYVDSSYAATAELLSTFLKFLDIPVSPQTATALLNGIVTDTGGFRYDNTTSETLKTAAWLLEKKADHASIMQKVYFEKPSSLLRMQGRLYEEMKFAFNNRLVYFFLTPEIFKEFGVNEKDTEDIVDVARVIEGVEIISRIQKTDDGIRFSFRSKNPAIPVNTLAHSLGGGGHEMAAGAYIKNSTLEEGEKLLLHYAQEILKE